MSTLKVNTIQDSSASNASTTEQIFQGRAKVWINFDGDTASATANLDGVNQSFNVTSLVDNTTGDFSINITSNMGNDDVCVSGHCPSDATNTAHQWGLLTARQKSEITASSVRVTTASSYNASQIDRDGVSVIFHGDLA